MKSVLHLFLSVSVILALAINPLKTNAQGVGDHLTMTLQNCSLIDPDTIQFDLLIMSDGASPSSLRLNACQYGVNFDSTILANSTDSVHTFYVNGSSDLLPLLGGFNFPLSVFRNHFKIIEAASTGGNKWGQGIVDVSDTLVTLVSGDHFICNFPDCERSNLNGNFWNSGQIVINGITDTVLSVRDSLHLILMNSAGTQTSVSYSVNSPNIINPMILNHQYRVGTFKISSVDTTGDASNFVNATSPNFTLQGVVVPGKTNCLALVYKDTAVSTTGISVTGTGTGQRLTVIDCNLTITSVKDAGAEEQIEIAPNPVNDHFIVSGLSLTGISTVNVFNILGTKIYTQSLTANRKQETINCKLLAGMYFVQINSGGKQFVRKIVVQ